MHVTAVLVAYNRRALVAEALVHAESAPRLTTHA